MNLLPLFFFNLLRSLSFGVGWKLKQEGNKQTDGLGKVMNIPVALLQGS